MKIRFARRIWKKYRLCTVLLDIVYVLHPVLYSVGFDREPGTVSVACVPLSVYGDFYYSF